MNLKNNISAGIVLYNPNIQRLLENIEHIIKQVDKVILFDNGSTNILKIEESIKTFDENIVLLKNNSNIGIASALNILCGWSYRHGYKFILTLDQDSVCPFNIVKVLQRDMKPRIAIVAPNIIYRNNETFSINKHGIEDVDWVITSASFTNLAIWKELDGFDENLFIDGVDLDFCYRATNKGYRIIKDNDVNLIHELGNLRCKKILGRTVYITNHPPLRKYYMVRNAIYLDKKLNIKRSTSYISKNILKTLIFENQKFVKMKYIFKGIKDGFRML